MKAADFDKQFDEGESILEALDMSTAKRPGIESRRVNVDFPEWMIDALDQSARRMGVTRQSVIKVWLSERIDQERKQHP